VEAARAQARAVVAEQEAAEEQAAQGLEVAVRVVEREQVVERAAERAKAPHRENG